jgi:hypothetical protein
MQRTASLHAIHAQQVRTESEAEIPIPAVVDGPWVLMDEGPERLRAIAILRQMKDVRP